LGPAIWGDTRIALPETATEYRDELTGARFAPDEIKDQLSLPLAHVLASFPVALLVGGEQ
jgi:maltooligosyltrehalose synthase